PLVTVNIPRAQQALRASRPSAPTIAVPSPTESLRVVTGSDIAPRQTVTPIGLVLRALQPVRAELGTVAIAGTLGVVATVAGLFPLPPLMTTVAPAALLAFSLASAGTGLPGERADQNTSGSLLNMKFIAGTAVLSALLLMAPTPVVSAPIAAAVATG